MNIKKRKEYRIEYFDVLPSTSAYLKEKRKEKKNYIVTAERQGNEVFYHVASHAAVEVLASLFQEAEESYVL